MAKIIVAHRGGKEFFHENTLEAFKNAIELGAQYYELDIRMTKDKKVVCFHDPDIQNKKITDITYEELKKLSGIKVPLFKEALKLTNGKIKLLCEIKETGYEKEAIKQIKEDFNLDDVIVVSFKDDVLFKIHKVDKSVKTGLIVGKKNLIQFIKDLFFLIRMLRSKTNFLIPNHNYIKFGIAKLAKVFGIKIFTWTIDDPKLIKKYLKNKDIYGIITNKPKLGLELLAAGSNRK